MKIWPLARRAELTDTMGNGTVPDHRPLCAGSMGFALLNVTETDGALPKLFTPSHAYAPSACEPFASFVVSSENE